MTPCIDSPAPRTPDGYARTGGRLQHRVAWERHNGPIPDGMTVDHVCFNRACINPEHLRLLTVSDNASLKASLLRPACPYGHQFTPENTYLRPEGKRARQCRACNREAVARYREKRQSA